MSNENQGLDWQDTQNNSYLDLCRDRLDQPLLTWVEQFINIINSWINSNDLEKSHIAINDYGCNVGHFFRGVVNINSTVSYIGYDISRAYLNIAKSRFGSHHFQFLDFSREEALKTIREADVSIISATLEHVLNFEQSIKNIFRNTKHLVIIRTFVGSNSCVEMCRTYGSAQEYLIRQFTVDDIVRIPLKEGWSVSRLVDVATQSEFKFVCNSESIKRKQEVFIFKKGMANERFC